MAQTRTFLVILVISIFTFISCEKEIEDPDYSMVLQLSDDDQFRSPLCYEFNRDGQLIRLDWMFMFAAVDYDLEGRPVRIYKDFGNATTNGITDISWNNEGFVIVNTHYVLNEKQLIENVYQLDYNGSAVADTTYRADYNYYGNDSLIIVEKGAEFGNLEHKYIFNDMQNPFSDVNIAVIKVFEMSFNVIEKGPFNYGFGEHAISQYTNGSGETYTVEYDLNDQNYLEKATIFVDGQAIDEVYYKYEM